MGVFNSKHMWHDDKHGEGMSVFAKDIHMWSVCVCVCVFTLCRPGCKDQSVYGLSDEFKLGVKCGSCYLHCSLWGLGQNGGNDSLVEAIDPVEEKNITLSLRCLLN